MERTAVTARKAGCDVSSSFLAADTYSSSAPNASAACERCSWVSVRRTPNQVKDSRIAAMTARNCSAAAWLGDGSSTSNKLDMENHPYDVVLRIDHSRSQETAQRFAHRARNAADRSVRLAD